jgi:hypothetical protein
MILSVPTSSSGIIWRTCVFSRVGGNTPTATNGVTYLATRTTTNSGATW